MKAPRIKLTSQEQRYFSGVFIPALLIWYIAHPGELVRDIAEAIKMRFTKEFVRELLKILLNRGKSTNDLQGYKNGSEFLQAAWARYDARGCDVPRPNEGDLDDAIRR